ncbi:MAG: hypothetical protein ACYCUY_09005 [Acidithiobacillus sp.]
MASGLAARMGMAAMRPAFSSIHHRVMLAIPASLLWLLLLCGTWIISAPAASAQINFAFSVGDGVNAYYLPMASNFVYAYDGYYYDWAGNGWLYSTDYIGPWYPLPPYSVLPLPLEYGPPPPMVPYQPYFVWWRARVAPWYQVNHPAWWLRHRVDLDHYRVWRARVIPRYRARPFYRGPMRPVFRPGFHGHPPFVHPFVRPFVHPFVRPFTRGRVVRPVIHPLVGRPILRPYVRRPVVHPIAHPALRGPVRRHRRASRRARPFVGPGRR